ncbi:uncharacterized protein N7469_006134 [Penicillium citrinum]|uniref:Uncharacterized protein n=2 Tax=Penicillium TaxID=5073 RepID=A0A9W9TM42_PENCI|nr:uncharacterized protein N7469_006134 [Penicillium citrinum]KAJ5231546.1 hypothetical protein N7469_006134 [Penicillium citrinum]KAJ5579081.1 hypothetical protein N7450_007948 [Penicillium hetheringtonii]KAK5787706.1 hypothetical protein VI817_010203 [Penicillium citrinum]
MELMSDKLSDMSSITHVSQEKLQGHPRFSSQSYVVHKAIPRIISSGPSLASILIGAIVTY